MTEREKEILELIKAEPSISQNDLALRLGIARSSVAVHITNLMKQGLILGKGYIVNTEPYVLVIGASNIDIQGVPDKKLIPKDSNIGSIELALGGVGRNIAENCTKLGINTKLISAVGDDVFGKRILAHSIEIGLNMADSLILKDQSSSIYLSILDENRDMNVAINAMASIDKIDVDFIQSKKHLIQNAQLILMDTNLKEEVIIEVTQLASAPIFIDTVSSTKALKIKSILNRIDTLKPNQLEAQILTGISIRTDEDIKANARKLHDLGVKNVYITLGPKGVYASTENEENFYLNPNVNVVNATGAGDAFISALVYAKLHEMNLKESVQVALSASALCLESTQTISDNLSVDNLMAKKLDYFI